MSPTLRTLALAALLALTARTAETALSAPALAAPDLAWWQGFGDVQLDALIRETLADNPDLKVAAARLGLAQTGLAATRAERSPTISLIAGTQRRAYSRTERAADPTLKTAATGLTLGASAAYEVDLWGRLARGVEANAAEVRASAEDAAALQLSLTGEIATTWFALRANAAETSTLAQRHHNARALLALLETRQSAGLADAAPAAEQRTTLSTLDGESAVLVRERAALLNRLAALRGLRPEQAAPLAIPPLESTPTNPLPADLTTAVLARRPDLRAASARLAAQQARVAEARAAALPAFALTAQGLFSGESLRELLRTGSLGALIAAPFTELLLDGGRRAARTASARAELILATETYVSLGVRAFQETADALATVESTQSELLAVENKLRHRRQLANLVEARFAVGRTDRLATLIAQAEVLTAVTDLTHARLAERQSFVILATTLGGDWLPPVFPPARLP